MEFLSRLLSAAPSLLALPRPTTILIPGMPSIPAFYEDLLSPIGKLESMPATQYLRGRSFSAATFCCINSLRLPLNRTAVATLINRIRRHHLGPKTRPPTSMLHATAGAVVSLVDRAAPRGTVAFLEEGGVEYGFSAQTAFVQGYNFGLWKGVLAAAGLRVEVVKPQAWKHALGLARSGSSKDDSRDMAAAMFPEVGDNLGRKKDHGRAEALLIAAYGHMATHARDARAAAAAAAAGRADAAEEEEEDPLCRRVRDMVTRAAEEAASSEASDDDGDGDETRRSGIRMRIGPNDPLPYFGPYFGMTGKALGEECRRRGLRVSGKKRDDLQAAIAAIKEQDFGIPLQFDISWWGEELKLYNAMIVALCCTYTFVQGSHVRVDHLNQSLNFVIQDHIVECYNPRSFGGTTECRG